MKKTLHYVLLPFLMVTLFSNAQTNVIAGITNITVTQCTLAETNKPGYTGLSSTSTDGITDGVFDQSSGRWLYQFGGGGSGAISDPSDGTALTVEIDLGTSVSIRSFVLTEVKSTSSYTFETWNGASWDIQASITMGSATGQEIGTIIDPQAFQTSASFPAVTTNKIRLVFTDNDDISTKQYIRVHELEVYDMDILGTDEFSLMNFSAYPNPVKGQYLNIKSNIKINKMQVFDVLGKRVNINFQKNNRLNVSTLSPGLYFARINDFYSLKFIKN